MPAEETDFATPALLSPDQLAAKAQAVIDSLASRGFEARVVESYDDVRQVSVTDPANYHCATLHVDCEGGATWDVWGETPGDVHTSAEAIVNAVATRLRAPASE